MSQFPHPCWSCHGPILESTAFCPTCSVIQPPDPAQNFFGVFSMQPGFKVEHDRIESLYQQLQQQFHPDRFVNKSPKERRYSLEHVTRLNEASRTLRDPLSLAIYLLQLCGHSSVAGDGGKSSDPAFLMEVMELREGLEELDLGRGDAEEALDAMRGGVEGKCKNEIGELGTLFADFFSSKNQALLDSVTIVVDRLRYYNRFLEELDQREESLF
jgi:molecular chaperone HscB